MELQARTARATSWTCSRGRSTTARRSSSGPRVRSPSCTSSPRVLLRRRRDREDQTRTDNGRLLDHAAAAPTDGVLALQFPTMTAPRLYIAPNHFFALRMFLAITLSEVSKYISVPLRQNDRPVELFAFAPSQMEEASSASAVHIDPNSLIPIVPSFLPGGAASPSHVRVLCVAVNRHLRSFHTAPVQCGVPRNARGKYRGARPAAIHYAGSMSIYLAACLRPRPCPTVHYYLRAWKWSSNVPFRVEGATWKAGPIQPPPKSSGVLCTGVSENEFKKALGAALRTSHRLRWSG